MPVATLQGCRAGGAMAPPDFGRSVNPISTRGDRLCPSNYYWPSRIFKPSDGSALEVGTWMHLAKNKVTKTCLYDATAFTLNLIKHSFCNALLINDTFYYLKKIMQCEKGHDLVTVFRQEFEPEFKSNSDVVCFFFYPT